jgi:hypothetical protein
MHVLYFVRVPEADTAEAAMKAATAVLDAQGFADDSTFFAHGRADWYTVGGRWSGIFTDLTPQGRKAAAEIERMLKRDYPQLDQGVRGISYGEPTLRGLHAIAAAVANDDYIEATGYPYIRDPYRVAPYGDDGVKLTPELLAALQKDYGETSVCLTRDGNIEGEDCLSEVADEQLIGSWLVAIDYHC